MKGILARTVNTVVVVFFFTLVTTVWLTCTSTE
jgi:hypothetical protein